MAAITVVVAPIMAISSGIAVKIQAKISEKSNEDQKEPDLLCGDTLTNIRTVQSFGNEEEIIKLYKKLLEPVYKTSRSQHL